MYLFTFIHVSLSMKYRMHVYESRFDRRRLHNREKSYISIVYHLYYLTIWKAYNIVYNIST